MRMQVAPSGELASPLAVAGDRLSELVATPTLLLLLLLLLPPRVLAVVGDSELLVGVATPPW